MINRIIEPTAGLIEIDGQDAMGIPAHELRRSIGYVIQQIGLFLIAPSPRTSAPSPLSSAGTRNGSMSVWSNW